MSRRFIMTTALLGSALFSHGVFAAQWQRDAGIYVSAIYSDNFCLDNSDKQEHVTSTFTPNLNMQAESARANLSLQAAAQINNEDEIHLDCRPRRSRSRLLITPSLRYTGDLEVIDEWLTLESDAFSGSNRIDPFEAGDNIDGRNNINITYQYGVGALLQRRVLKSADMRLRYRYSEQYNEEDLFGDNRQDEVDFDLGTDRDSTRFSTGISADYRKIYYDASRLAPAFNNTLSSAELWVALQLTTSWEINALSGEEWNEFTSASDDIEGSYWDAGLEWTPNERVTIGVGTGERFFGTTSRFNISYRHKRSALAADYDRTLTFPSDLRGGIDNLTLPIDPESEDSAEPVDSSFDSGFGQLPGETTLARGNPTFIGDSPIIDERFTLYYRFTGRRSTLSVSASESQQFRLEDNGEATFTYFNTTFARKLSARLVADIQFNWSESEGQGGNVGRFGDHSKTLRFGPGVSRRVGAGTTVTLRHEYTRQRSDFSANEYNENRIILSLSHIFRSHNFQGMQQ